MRSQQGPLDTAWEDDFDADTHTQHTHPSIQFIPDNSLQVSYLEKKKQLFSIQLIQ